MCVCNRLSQSKNFCMKIIKYNIVAGVLFYPETGGVNCHLPQLTVADILVLPATIGDLERPNTELLDGDASQEARIAGIDLQLNPVSIPPPLMSRFRPETSWNTGERPQMARKGTKGIYFGQLQPRVRSLSLSRPPVPCGGFLWIVQGLRYPFPDEFSWLNVVCNMVLTRLSGALTQ